MKCIREYECCYLDKSNIEEFIEWFKENFDDVYNYISGIFYLSIFTKDPNDDDFDEDLNEYFLVYDRWYIIKDNSLYDYNKKYFLKHYNVID